MIRNFFASIFSVVFLLFFLAFFSFYSIDKTFFNENSYLSNQFIDTVYSNVLDSSYKLYSLDGRFSDLFTEQEFFLLFQRAFANDDLEKEISSILSIISDLPIDDSGNVNISIPFDFLKKYKEQINSIFSKAIYEKISVCSEDSPDSTLCSAFVLNEEVFLNEFQKEMDKSFYSLLEEDFNVLWYIGDGFSNTVSSAYIKIKYYLFGLITLVLLFSVLIIVVMLWGHFIKLLRWLSLLFLISALFSIYIFYVALNGEFIYFIFQSLFSKTSFFDSYFAYFSSVFFSSVFVILVAIAISSVLLFSSSFLFNRNKYV